MREEKEVKEGKEVKEKGGSVAAFFDVDGTLVARPSLERRFFWMLRYRRAIPRKNYLLWMMEAARLAPRGMAAIAQANKMYLRGVRVGERGRGTEMPVDRGEGNETRKKRQPGMAVPLFSSDAMERVEWHARCGHAIVLVSGTLEPLANEAAFALVVRLAACGVQAAIGVCATRLEEKEGKWTGRIAGEAMFGEAKGRAVRRLAVEQGFDLAGCYAYGDSASDEWLLEAVGKPAAVNPSKSLARIARRRGWPVLSWEKDNKRNETQRCGVRREGLLMEERWNSWIDVGRATGLRRKQETRE